MNVVDGISGAEFEAILTRGQAGELTERDRARLALFANAASELLPGLIEAVTGVVGLIPFFDAAFISDLANMVNTGLRQWGVDAQITIQPSWPTEPRAGAELGGKPRNPEADVIDEIDRLVDWQIGKGEGW